MDSVTKIGLPTDVVKSSPSDIVKENVLKVVPRITKQTRISLPGISKQSPDLTPKSIIKKFDLICSKRTSSISNNIKPQTGRPVISLNTDKPMLNNITPTDNKICIDSSKNLLKPLKEPVFIKATIIPKTSIKERQTSTSTTSISNVNLCEGNNIKKAFYDKSLTLNQAFEQFKRLSSKANDTALIKPGSDKVVPEYLGKESTPVISKPNNLELKPEEKLKILGFARENTQGQLIYTDFTNVNKDIPNKIITKSPSHNCNTSKLLANTPNSKKKQITILLPPDIYSNEHPKTIVSDCQKEKNVINKKTETSIFALESETGQMLDTEPKHLSVSADQDLNQNTTTVPKILPYSVRQPQLSVITGLDLQKTLSHSLEQSHPALDLGKSLQFTVGQPQSKFTTALKLQKPHSLELLQTTNTSVSNTKNTIVPNTPVPNNISRSVEQYVHKSIGNNETLSLFNTRISGKPKVHTVLPLKKTALSTATSEEKILMNLVPYMDKNEELPKSVTSKENCSQYPSIKPNMCEKEILINNLNNNSASNQLISHTLDKLPISECVIEKNNAKDFNSISDNNNAQNIRRGSTEVMWSTLNFNSTGNLEQNVLLCALNDMTQCRKEDEEGNIPLQKAVLDNDKNTLKRQCIILKIVGLQHLNHQNKSLDTALLLAVKSNQEVFVATLLNYGANQTIVDKDGNTALHVAVHYGYLVCARLLLAAEGTRDIINAFNDEGFAPIHLAAMNGYNEIVRALVSEGADINKKDAKSGRTAYHHGILLNKPDVLKVLGGLGCNTSELDFAGHLPLFEEVIVNSPTIKHSSLLMKSDRKEMAYVLPRQIPQFEPARLNQTQSLSKSSTSEVVNNKRNRNEADFDQPQFEFITLPSIKLVNINENVNKTITVHKNKRRRFTNEVVTLSSDDSDTECVVIKNAFKPAIKRRSNKVLCINDDNSNDCTIINNPTSEIHSYNSYMPIVKSHVCDVPGVDRYVNNMPLIWPNSSMTTVHSQKNAVPVINSLNCELTNVYSFNNDVPIAHSHKTNVTSIPKLHTDDEKFKGFTNEDDLSDNQLIKMEDIIKKFIHDSQVF